MVIACIPIFDKQMFAFMENYELGCVFETFNNFIKVVMALTLIAVNAKRITYNSTYIFTLHLNAFISLFYKNGFS